MQISSINNYSRQNMAFRARNNEYENPINRKTERNLAVWTSLGGSALLGTIFAGIGSCFINKGVANRAWKLGGIGAAAALLSLILTLPAKLYDTKVKAFTREKEMDVFTRDRDLKSNIMEQVNDEIKDDEVSLNDKINHYTSIQMANNGKGVLLKGV